MSTETALIFWAAIAVVLAVALLINTFLWRKVIVKIIALHKQIQELEAENAELRKEK